MHSVPLTYLRTDLCAGMAGTIPGRKGALAGSSRPLGLALYFGKDPTASTRVLQNPGWVTNLASMRDSLMRRQ
jgi:hypothetical protein